MDISKFTEKAKDIISNASNITVKNNNAEITDYHIVSALLDNSDDLITMILKKMDVDVPSLKTIIQSKIDEMPKAKGSQDLKFAPNVEKTLVEAEIQAQNLGDTYIAVEHIMLGIFEHGSDGLKKLFKNMKVDKKKFLVALKEIRQNTKLTDEEQKAASSSLTKFGKDVTELARQNRLNPVIGRDEEIRNVIRILSRKTKNNPILIGEPGVGKTAIVEGLAQRIIRGDVPTSLKGKTLFELDLGLLIA